MTLLLQYELSGRDDRARAARVTGVSPWWGGSFARALQAAALRARRLQGTAVPPQAATGHGRNGPIMSHKTSRTRPSASPASVPPADNETGTRMALANLAALVEAGSRQ
jgi:hypothetical protein